MPIQNNEASPFFEPTPPAEKAPLADQVGPFSPVLDVPDSSVSAAQQTDAFYPETTMDVRYDIHPGVAVQPLAQSPDAEGNTCEKVQLTAAYMTKTLSFTMERLGEKPVIPDWNDPDPNLVLTYVSVTDAVPLDGPNGIVVWRVSGTYVWRLLKPLDPNTPWPVGTSPASTRPAVQTALDPVQRDAMLLG